MYAKNARQQGLPLTLDPRVLYRGLGAALCNEMGQLGLQFGVNGAITRAIVQDETPSPVQELGTAAAAGAIVALLASPLELIMIQQQRFGGAMLATGVEIVKSHGFFGMGLFRGLGLAMLRDSIYVGGMLGATPVVYRQLIHYRGSAHETGPAGIEDDTASGACIGTTSSFPSSADAALMSMAASVISGVFVAVLSHPFDVAKTCMQGDLSRATYGGSLASLRTLLNDGGAARLLRGCTWRTVNITATVYIANECSLRLPKYVREP